MKTPEEMAEEYAQTIDACCGTSDIIIAAENGFLAGYKAAQPQWISVEDRLPSEDQDVLFYSPTYYSEQYVGYRAKPNEWCDPNGLTDAVILKYYSHWMSLPTPPEEK